MLSKKTASKKKAVYNLSKTLIKILQDISEDLFH